MMMKKQSILNFPIYLGSYRDFIDKIISLALSGKSSYICVASVHQLIEAHKDVSYSSIIHGADLVTPDGMPITWGLKLLYNIKQERVAGMDLLPDLLKEAENLQLPIFFYGGTEKMLSKTKLFLEEEYPALIVKGFYSPPFRKLTELEIEQVISKINNSNARLIFVVLGCPKQEKWMAEMKNKINATMIGIGGAVPVLIKMQRRAPRWMQKSGLEWVFRLFQEPKRLWKRYLVTNYLFIYYLLKAKWKQRNHEPMQVSEVN